MSDQTSTLRQNGGRQAKVSAESMLLNDGIGPTRIMRAARMHFPLFLIVLGMILGVTALATVTSRPDYGARAVLSIAREPQPLTRRLKHPPPPGARPRA